ncbi:MAG: amidohydrolase [Myxococcales bacterium]|nr:amidohydrolase [Myxococcales bacterium]
MSRYLIISSDCHAGLPTREYRSYLESKYHARFDESVRQNEAMRAELVKAGMSNPAFAKKWYEENEEGLRGGWDAARRDKELDADGVAGEVLFSDADAVTGQASAPFGAGLGMSGDSDPELVLAGARAHNRWLAELCAESPQRRAGLALLPSILHDPELAVAEVRWAKEAGLRGGVLIPAMWGSCAPYHDPRYEPVWATCEELGMPIHTHSGPASRDEYGGLVGLYITEVRWWCARPLWFLLWSGVFERHPRLKFAVTEGSCHWVPELLYNMDQVVLRETAGAQKLGPNLTKLSLLPSEYFDRNCFIGASSTKRREIALRYEIGVGNMMWGNDFPHPEGTWPHTKDWLRRTFCDIPAQETRQMLGTTAAEVFNFDTEALAPLVERIGPTPADLGQEEAQDLEKWRAAEEVGRHWLTGKEPIPTGPRAA